MFMDIASDQPLMRLLELKKKCFFYRPSFMDLIWHKCCVLFMGKIKLPDVLRVSHYSGLNFEIKSSISVTTSE